MGGFAEVEANEVNVLVNGAEPASSIDASTVQAELDAAQQVASGFESKPNSPEKFKAQQALLRAKARVQAVK